MWVAGCRVCVVCVYARSRVCWSRSRITCRHQQMSAVAARHAEDARGRWHDVEIPAWVVLVIVMVLIVEILLISLAFIAGMKFQGRCAVPRERKGLPPMMVRAKTGDRLHVAGCYHMKQSEMEGTVTILQVCDHCRSKSKGD